jgi:tRNA U34 2-thiouridine synthase MnmA/TrmU
MVKKIRACVLLSGGLDSLLAIKIMQEQGAEIFALFFKFPFAKDLQEDLQVFSKKENIHLNIFDCTKGKLLDEYLRVIKKAKYGRGVGFNSCIDCRIFLFKKAKEFAKEKKLDLIVTGEVLDERPMSQKRKMLNLVEKESELKGILLRPLSAKLLEITIAEQKNLINREAFFGIHGRRRIKQMELAKKFNLSYPSPAGGCLLCEKGLKKRFKLFFAMENLWKHFNLLSVGRHFFIENNWIILGRNEKENEILEKVKGGFLIVPDYSAPSVLIFGKIKESTKKKANNLIQAYSSEGSSNKRKLFEEYKI